MLDEIIEYAIFILIPISITHAFVNMIFGVEGFWYWIIQGFVLYTVLRIFIWN